MVNTVVCIMLLVLMVIVLPISINYSKKIFKCFVEMQSADTRKLILMQVLIFLLFTIISYICVVQLMKLDFMKFLHYICIFINVNLFLFDLEYILFYLNNKVELTYERNKKSFVQSITVISVTLILSSVSSALNGLSIFSVVTVAALGAIITVLAFAKYFKNQKKLKKC